MSRTYRLRLEHASRPVSARLMAWAATEREPRTLGRWFRRKWLLSWMTPEEWQMVSRSAVARAWSTRRRLARAHRHTNLTDEQINQLTRKELTR